MSLDGPAVRIRNIDEVRGEDVDLASFGVAVEVVTYRVDGGRSLEHWTQDSTGEFRAPC